MAVAAVVVVVIRLASDGDDQRDSAAPSTVSSTAASRSPSAAAVPVTTPTESSVRYKKVSRPCQAANFTALEQRLGPRRDTKPIERTSTSGSVTIMTCSVRIGSRGDTVIVQAAVFAGRTGKTMYEGLRRVNQSDYALTNVPDLGTDAYTYANPELGTYVVAYDSNLYITVAYAPVERGPGGDADLPTLLAQVCRQTMVNLAA